MTPRLRRFGPAALLVPAVLIGAGCSSWWPSFRHNLLRDGQQRNSSDLAKPAKVQTLHVGWQWSPPGANAFRGSPVVWKHRVFIGNGNGRFYALRASDGALLWQYPAAGQPALTSQFTCNPSSNGIASSATYASINGVDAVIFGAPDQSFGSGLGEGRLFALRMSDGAVIWKSPVVAHLDGFGANDRHQQIGYASPLVYGDRVYIGIADHCDNPIQQGRVVAVQLATGAIAGGFDFAATSTRGGGVWTHLAGWPVNGGNKLFVTTGNTKSGNPVEPPVNHGLSMLQLDAATGVVDWKLQPVPFALDGDPDWAAGATVVGGPCGLRIVSTMKDGWSYAVDPTTGSCAWQFPETPPAGCSFSSGDGTSHGDIRYLRAGAAWRDVYITMTGGENVTTDVTGGYGRLHALNVCASNADRVRWILDVPGANCGGAYRLGPPTVTHGIVYVGTCSGRLIAFGDPSIYPAAGWRCRNPALSVADCVANGFTLVPIPAVLADVQLQGAIMTEPALAEGRVYVATGFWNDAGTLYMLRP